MFICTHTAQLAACTTEILPLQPVPIAVVVPGVEDASASLHSEDRSQERRPPNLSKA